FNVIRRLIWRAVSLVATWKFVRSILRMASRLRFESQWERWGVLSRGSELMSRETALSSRTCLSVLRILDVGCVRLSAAPSLRPGRLVKFKYDSFLVTEVIKSC